MCRRLQLDVPRSEPVPPYRCPPEAYIVYGAGTPDANGVYASTGVEAHGTAIFRHVAVKSGLLARERCGDRLGWLVGAGRRPLYGVRTEAERCPQRGWRTFRGDAPAPAVEGFPSLEEACLRLAQVWQEEGELLESQGSMRRSAEVYRSALGLPALPRPRAAELHALRARAFRQLAEGKTAAPGADLERDPLQGLAAERAIEEAEKALKLDAKCFLAGWEGAAAARQASEATPPGPAHRAQREAAGALFLRLAEEEQREKAARLLEVQQAKLQRRPAADPAERRWAAAVAAQLNEALKVEDFRRPHHQLWKLVSPRKKSLDSDAVFGEIRLLVWQKWSPVAAQHGYRTAEDVAARRGMCERIAEVANTGGAPEVAALVSEMENRVCLEWSEVAEATSQVRHDDTWAWARRQDGSWGTPWGGGMSRRQPA
ncbi:unnamed protein product [Prorocentrum cordatum]|uniref:Uncharacterized protein n=1 Tax=Prorocentrum cordatum TaxID=2364126 RepID=A0ABN9RWE7_9DINO|nr:unnamed protein product [Polarella glacialis]